MNIGEVVRELEVIPDDVPRQVEPSPEPQREQPAVPAST